LRLIALVCDWIIRSQTWSSEVLKDFKIVSLSGLSRFCIFLLSASVLLYPLVSISTVRMFEEGFVVMEDDYNSHMDEDVDPQPGRKNFNHKSVSHPTITTFKVVQGNTVNNYSVLCKFSIPVLLAICTGMMLQQVQEFQLLQQQWLWIIGGTILALLVFESTQHDRPSKTELLVKVSPLGVQRYLTRNNRHDHHHPLCLMECIQDCILVEHVGAFAVTTHVMFRVRTKQMYDDQETLQLVPAFPNACLSFSQCHTLKHEIQASLEKIR
jgi:hypothetical protein